MVTTIFSIIITILLITILLQMHDDKNNKKAVIKVKPWDDRDIEVPTKGTEDAAAFDLYASWTESEEVTDALKRSIDFKSYNLQPGECTKVHTNLCMEIPKGYYLDICSRSGLSINDNIVVINSPARIDSDYRGEIIVGLKNLSDKEYRILEGDRIAQCTLHKIVNTEFQKCASDEEFSKTDRGNGGLGHTGKK